MSLAKRVPKANREGKRGLCENLTPSPRQAGRNSGNPKLRPVGALSVQVRAQVWQVGCLDDSSPAGCTQVLESSSASEKGFFSCWWLVGQGWVGRPGAVIALPCPVMSCPVSGSLDFSSQLPQGPNAPCRMAGRKDIGKGLWEMVLPQFATLRQAA